MSKGKDFKPAESHHSDILEEFYKMVTPEDLERTEREMMQMIRPKPIFIVLIPEPNLNGFDKSQEFKALQKGLERNLQDYNVLIMTKPNGDIDFRCFYEKDFDEIKFEELKQLVLDNFKKQDVTLGEIGFQISSRLWRALRIYFEDDARRFYGEDYGPLTSPNRFLKTITIEHLKKIDRNVLSRQRTVGRKTLIEIDNLILHNSK